MTKPKIEPSLMFTDITKDPRDKQVLLRLTVAEKEALVQLAKGKRLRLTSYLRALIRRAREAAQGAG